MSCASLVLIKIWCGCEEQDSHAPAATLESQVVACLRCGCWKGILGRLGVWYKTPKSNCLNANLKLFRLCCFWFGSFHRLYLEEDCCLEKGILFCTGVRDGS